MAVFRKTITIDFENPRQKSIRDWLESTGLDPKSLPGLTLEVSFNAAPSDFDDDEIADHYESLFPTELSYVERAYRYLAEGDCKAAMEELAHEFGLAPPSHERAIADLLSGNRSNTHVQG